VGVVGGKGYVHKHPRCAADTGDPVDKLDVYITGVVDFTVDGGVDKEPKSK